MKPRHKKFFKKLFHAFRAAAPFFLVITVFLSIAFYPQEEEKVQQPSVVRIWNIDTFEGGKGSRTSFLKKVAKLTEKENDGVYYLVTSMTKEGAEAAFVEGKSPDILSFGLGVSFYTEKSLPLTCSFSGGETEEGCLAYPWCRGGYALFSLDGDFAKEGLTAVSNGGNLVSVAAAFAEIEGIQMDSLAAYTGFLSGKYRYLLGTQRDLCRFSSRNVSVSYRALSEYCDLYQYVSILSAERKEACEAFLQTLLSEEIQSSLAEIGMYSLWSQDDFLGEATLYTVSAFVGESALKELAEVAKEKDSIKNLKKYLKTI